MASTAPLLPADVDGLWAAHAISAAHAPRTTTSPNPSVGCVIVTESGMRVEGWTHPPGGLHAEAHALAEARARSIDVGDACAYVTLEPCSHQGRTPPCADALVEAGVARVVVGIADPDVQVAGRGLRRLEEGGVEVVVARATDPAAAAVVTAIRDQLSAYLRHRTTGRPLVTLKLASTLDGRTAAPDGTSQWITGEAARADAQRLRGAHDAILVGAGTVRTDDPQLTVREPAHGPSPRRVVLGRAPAHARVHPCIEEAGPLDDVLARLGASGITSLMVEGGPTVAHAFHAGGHVDRYVLYLAPALMGGDDGAPLLVGVGAPTIADVWRGRIEGVQQLGTDLRIEVVPDERQPQQPDPRRGPQRPEPRPTGAT